MPFRFSWDVLEVGSTRRDGGAFFGAVPRPEWVETVQTVEKRASYKDFDAHVSRQNEITIGCNILLLRTEEDNILVDVGPPLTTSLQIDKELGHSKIRAVLRGEDIKSKDISKIILTSTDSDHAGALSMCDRAGKDVPAFPKATVYCQDNNRERLRPFVVPRSNELLTFLEERGKLQMTSCAKDFEVSPGIFVHSVSGPSQWSAVVEVRRGPEIIFFLGDLCPTPSHLNSCAITAHDDEPDHTFTQKKYWLDRAEAEGAIIVFSHGNKVKAGYLEDTKAGRRLRPA